VKVYTYPADHGFSCDERGEFERASHEKALKVTLAFFRQNLEN
jgi:carboxymethylenebutenolidase